MALNTIQLFNFEYHKCQNFKFIYRTFSLYSTTIHKEWCDNALMMSGNKASE